MTLPPTSPLTQLAIEQLNTQRSLDLKGAEFLHEQSLVDQRISQEHLRTETECAGEARAALVNQQV